MVIVRAHIIEGRPAEKKQQLIAGLTEVAAASLNVEPTAIRVLLIEIPAGHWGIGGNSVEALTAARGEQKGAS